MQTNAPPRPRPASVHRALQPCDQCGRAHNRYKDAFVLIISAEFPEWDFDERL